MGFNGMVRDDLWVRRLTSSRTSLVPLCDEAGQIASIGDDKKDGMTFIDGRWRNE